MNKQVSAFVPVLRLGLVCLVLCSVIYPLAVTGIGQLFFPYQADGSLIKDDSGNVIGSELIGQTFTDPALFQGRVSSIDNDAAGSGTPNYAPSNPDMISRTEDAIDDQQAANPDSGSVPLDLVTNSGSGLDPHISVEAAEFQVSRIAEASGISQEELYKLIDQHRKSQVEELLGAPAVNVLRLNIDLQALK
ncbi:potassium-transporting ATPase subunit C [Terribacillus saccharophilus]|uniref:potassium-transporting ATPase subunit KdpC n=1 Tax=Terribacillus saccharophilus TaxID=361277 RepID=UPI000BA56437|nr:potassium-transporting ATPase subunit KdpC [Terribacillus saccharophilus]PAF20624.1 potassium-transporting ATPase subunit C [Terribacillus saccharophilus]